MTTTKREISKEKKTMVILLLIGFIFMASAVNKYFHLLIKSSWNTKCVIDTFQWLFLPLSYKIVEFPVYGNILLGVDSFCVDSVILFMSFYWMIHAQSHNFAITVFMFYLIRAGALNLAKFPLPDPYLFNDPGFPSIFVPYGKTNDLYYSGHIGLTTIVVLECISYKWKRFLFFAIFTFLTTGFMLIVLGVHYSNDIIIGFAAAVFLQRFTFRVKYNLALFFLKVYCHIVYFFDAIIIARLNGSPAVDQPHGKPKEDRSLVIAE
jgi:hypothetical protein